MGNLVADLFIYLFFFNFLVLRPNFYFWNRDLILGQSCYKTNS